jgi:hypothetical protein
MRLAAVLLLCGAGSPAAGDHVGDIIEALTDRVDKGGWGNGWFAVSAMLCAANPVSGGGGGCQMAGIPVIKSLSGLRGVEAAFGNHTGGDKPTVSAAFDQPTEKFEGAFHRGAYVGVRMTALPLGKAAAGALDATSALLALTSVTNYSSFNVLSISWPLNPCVVEPLFIFSVVEPASPTGFVEVFVGANSGRVCRGPETKTVTKPPSCEHGDEPNCWN